MTELNYEYEYFYSKKGFNNAATHFDTVAEILGDFQQKINLADKLNLLLNEKTIVQPQVPTFINALLVEKFNYQAYSYNLTSNFQTSQEPEKIFKDWNGVDIVLAYNHPDLGYTVLNPKNKRHWDSVSLFKSNELLTVYVGVYDKTTPGDKIYDLAIKKILDFFNGKTVTGSEPLKKGSCRFISIEPEDKPVKSQKTVKKAAAGKQKSTGKTPIQKADSQAVQVPEKKAAAARAEESQNRNRRMTPFYSVPVTNELFHNGNVEAWKKVIQSYQTKHKGLEVYIYYDGERIHDIHSLFKWGKVKHGSTILFAVAGEEIKDVAKLQRYLIQGASHRFEDFLKYPVNTILNLF